MRGCEVAQRTELIREGLVALTPNQSQRTNSTPHESRGGRAPRRLKCGVTLTPMPGFILNGDETVQQIESAVDGWRAVFEDGEVPVAAWAHIEKPAYYDKGTEHETETREVIVVGLIHIQERPELQRVDIHAPKRFKYYAGPGEG